jgi:hypothetical protein
VLLAQKPDSEDAHESSVKDAADRFIGSPRALSLDFDAINVTHNLFSLHPKAKNKAGRQVLTANIATDHINDIISYAAADAEAEHRIKFYNMISKQPMFRIAQGRMFECFVLTWLSSYDMTSLPCTPTRAAGNNSPKLEIPSCRCDDEHKICGSLSDLQNTRVTAVPFCFLPSSTSVATADAVVITKQFIITIQVTIADSYDAKGKGFNDIRKSLPAIATTPEKQGIRTRKSKPPSRTWCHVFLTDTNDKAGLLRNQTLPEIPKGTYVYSAVFDVGQFNLDSRRMRRLNRARVRGSSIGCI